MLTHLCRSMIAVVVVASAASALDTVTITTLSPTAYEQGTVNGSFLFTRTGTSGPLAVTYAIGGSATNVTDYAALPAGLDAQHGIVSFASGSATAVLTIAPVDDAIVEGSETITLQIVSGTQPYIIGGLSSSTVTIGDNDVEARMTGPDPIADEVSQSAGYTPRALLERATLHLSLSQTQPGAQFRGLPRTIPVQIGGTATLGTDYTLVYDGSIGARLKTSPAAIGATSFTISNGDSSSISGYLDSANYFSMSGFLVVPDCVSLTNVRGFYSIASYVPTGIDAAVTLNQGLSQAAGVGTEVRRVIYAVSNTPSSGAARGDTTVTLNIVGPPVVGVGQVIKLVGEDDVAHFSSYTITAADPITGICTVSPALTENVAANTTVYSGAGVARGTVAPSSTALLGYTPLGASTIEYDNCTSSSGQFISGDYIAIDGIEGIYKIVSTTATSVTVSTPLLGSFGDHTRIFRIGTDAQGLISAAKRLTLIDNIGGASDVDFYAFPIDDGIVEGRETVTISLVAQPDYQSVTPAVATATISDDDVQADIVFTSNAGEPATAGSMTITLSSPLPQAITVPYQVVGFAGGAGVAKLGPAVGADYTLTGADPLTGIGTVTIPAGSTSVVLSINPLNDAVVETGGETVTINLLQTPDYWLVTSGTSGSNPSATLNIADKEGTVSVVVQSATAREGAGPATLTNAVVRFSLLNSVGVLTLPTQDLGVRYTVSGTAVAGTDYTALSGNVIIPAATGFIDLTIPTLDDLVVDPGESINLVLAGGPGYDISAIDSSVSVIIADDEPVVGVTASTSPTETGTVGSFVVSYPGVPVGTALNRPVVVTYTVTSASTATAGADYSTLSGTVTIPANNLSTTIDVTTVDDAVLDPNETVVVDLGASTSAYQVDSTKKTASLTIVDNESVLTVAATTAAQEPATNGLFTITASTAVTGSPLVVTYSVSGTATPGTDYTALSGTATIAVGATSTTIPVTIINDLLADPGETIIVTLSSGPTATMTIIDDESSQIAFSTGAATVIEGATATITVTRSGSTVGAVSAMVTSTAGTATAGTDYTTLAAPVAWANGEGGSKTVALVTTADITVEPAETLTLGLGSITGASAGTISSMTITIQDAAAATAEDTNKSSSSSCGSGLGVMFLFGFLTLMWRRLRD